VSFFAVARFPLIFHPAAVFVTGTATGKSGAWARADPAGLGNGRVLRLLSSLWLLPSDLVRGKLRPSGRGRIARLISLALFADLTYAPWLKGGTRPARL